MTSGFGVRKETAQEEEEEVMLLDWGLLVRAPAFG